MLGLGNTAFGLANTLVSIEAMTWWRKRTIDAV